MLFQKYIYRLICRAHEYYIIVRTIIPIPLNDKFNTNISGVLRRIISWKIESHICFNNLQSQIESNEAIRQLSSSCHRIYFIDFFLLRPFVRNIQRTIRKMHLNSNAIALSFSSRSVHQNMYSKSGKIESIADLHNKTQRARMALLFFIVRFVWLANASESSNYINYFNFRGIFVDAELKMSNFVKVK